ncbi:hypothetical protein SE15_00585 [Thermanaerothrix daxensis]|uniref:Adenosylcobinamide-GDP ribazoletransferase n=1 Tax=Thermanaerothrix daxensis TaxID=869279 RepID=A0A0P6XWL2_9CHLR|nr:adenosylcobinamide-GDP ribazoletransferase [Thermanaerothrix daxensis]KPL83789.1 hypothetical protein SE15_00585 [Thermanaerothrix daxensis]
MSSPSPSFWNDLRQALAFLTRLPLPSPSHAGTDFARALPWFPLVGLGMGAILFGLVQAAQLVISPLIAAVLGVFAWAGLSGFLHLDALADCWDALFPPLPPEKRHQVLKDPHLGAFGVTGLVLHLLLKVATLLSTLSLHPIGLLLAPVLGRWLVLWLGLLPAARPEGLGAAFARAVTPRILGVSSLLPLILLPLGGWRSGVALLLAALATTTLGSLARRYLGGVTGDVLGAAIEVSEVLTLLAFSIP